MDKVLTIRDFTQVFDAYAEFSESYISSVMDQVAAGDEDADEADLDDKMKQFEKLMDRRPFLVNEVLIRRNPNDVQEWEKRVALHGTNDEAVSLLFFLTLFSADRRISYRSMTRTNSQQKRSTLAKLLLASICFSSIGLNFSSKAEALQCQKMIEQKAI